MSTSYTTIESATFTIVHAKYMASKVATDLKRFQRFYGQPSDRRIEEFEAELVQFLKHDVLEHVIYGFKRDGKWTAATVRYTALPGGTLSADDDPGKIRPGLDVSEAAFSSFLTYNAHWKGLSQAERDAIESACPFQRTTAPTPALEAGYWASDLNYVAGGRGLGRSMVRR